MARALLTAGGLLLAATLVNAGKKSNSYSGPPKNYTVFDCR
jgi:hypothetical protein